MILHGLPYRFERSSAARLAAAGNAVQFRLTRDAEQLASALSASIALVSIFPHDAEIILASLVRPFLFVPRREGFCRHAVDRPPLFEVRDVALDPHSGRLLSVKDDPGVRYYFGAGVVLSGSIFSEASCVVYVEARRSGSLDERACLTAVSRQVGRLLERRRRDAGELAS